MSDVLRLKAPLEISVDSEQTVLCSPECVFYRWSYQDDSGCLLFSEKLKDEAIFEIKAQRCDRCIRMFGHHNQ